MRQPTLEQETLYATTTFRHLLDSMARPGKINQLEYPPCIGGEAPYYSAQAAGTTMPVNPYAFGALLTLLDREVTFVVAADGHWLSHTAPLIQWLILRSGSTLATPEAVTFAFFCQGNSNGQVTQLNRGTLLEPESSATVFYCVERLSAATDLTGNGRQGQALPLQHGTALEADERPIVVEAGLAPAFGPINAPTSEFAPTDLESGVTLELTGPGIEVTRTVSVVGLHRNEVELMKVARQSYPLGIDVYLVDGVGNCIGLPRTTYIHLVGKELQDGVCRS